MAAYTFDSILKDLKKKVYHPIYFLFGDEPYFIDEIANHIEGNVLSDLEKEFNQTILYGRDVDAKTIVSYARRYPMMSNYQVVIIREAQDIKDLFPKKKGEDGDDDSNDSDQDLFFDYLSNPLSSTILVFCYKYKKPDKRTKSGKLLEKQSVYFESKKIYDNQLPAWISSYVKARGYKIDDQACLLMGEYLGNDLAKISNELDKLMINIKAGSSIDNTTIENNIGISKDYNVFELQSALTSRDVLKANRIINYFGANPKSNPIILTLSTLNSFFTKIITYHVFKGKPDVNMAALLGVHPFYLKDYERAARTFSRDHAMDIISMLHDFDMRSKGVGNASASEHDLLRELVFKIMHPNAVAV